MSVQTLTIEYPTHQNLEHAGDIIIASHYAGTLYCEGRITIQTNGSIVGEVHAQNAHKTGTYKGFLEVKQYVIFTDGSKFEGTLDALEELSLYNKKKTCQYSGLRSTESYMED